MTKKPSLVFLAALLATTAGLVGCNDNGVRMGSVSGTVTLNGEPVEAAIINFTSETARAAIGEVKNGEILPLSTFGEGDGVPVGTHRVVIQEMYVQSTNNNGDPYGGVRPAVDIPPLYAQITSTPFLEEVKPGENNFTFELESK